MSETPLKITHSDGEWHPKYFAVVVGLFCALYMITNAMNSKFLDLGGLVLPAGILAFPLCCVITDLLTEVYGFNRARQAIWTAMVSTVLYAALLTLVMHLPAPSFWQNQAAYEAIFSTTWRLALAGCLAWLAGEFTNSYIVARMKIWQGGKNMAARFIGSTVVGQFFDTFVFCIVAFAGTMPLKNFLILMVTAWIFKVAYEIIALPLSVPITKWVKRLEGIEHFDDRQKLSIV